MTARRVRLDGVMVEVEWVADPEDEDAFGTVVVSFWDGSGRWGDPGEPLTQLTLLCEEVPLFESLLGLALDDRARWEHENGKFRRVRPLPDPTWVESM